MSTLYATDHLNADARFEFWRDVICDAYLPIGCETPDSASFTGRITLDRLSKLDLSRVSGSPQHITRRKGHIARNSDAFFMLSVQLSGSGYLTQNQRSTVLYPGDIGLYSSVDPYEIICKSAVDQLIVQVPADALLARLPQAQMVTGLGVCSGSGLGAMVSQHLRQCAGQVGAQTAIVQSYMQDMILDLIATGFASLSDSALELSRPEQLLWSRAQSTIRDNLQNDTLNPAFVADRMGMSQRNLGRVFQREGTSIAACIRRARMEAIASDLRDPRFVSLSISQIACKWGINNFQHFSKAFKDAHGLTPRAYRATKRKLQ